MYDSVTTWRLYSAEQSISLGQPLPDLAAAQALVDRVRASAWWRALPVDVPVRVELGGEDHDGYRSSYSAPEAGFGRTASWLISIHPGMLNDLVVLHELAHCIAPEFQHSGRVRRGDELLTHSRLPVHGAEFAAAMAELVGQFGAVSHHDELREAFAHYEVPTLTAAELREAIAGGYAAADEIQAQHDELKARYASDPASSSGRIPQWVWGDLLLAARMRVKTPAGRWASRTYVAQLVSRVQFARARDIETLERAEGLPDSPRMRRIAMCMVAALGIDPIYARFEMGLTRWDCGVELDELEKVDSAWAGLVRDMNAKLAARPPRWFVIGQR